MVEGVFVVVDEFEDDSILFIGRRCGKFCVKVGVFKFKEVIGKVEKRKLENDIFKVVIVKRDVIKRFFISKVLCVFIVYLK